MHKQTIRSISKTLTGILVLMGGSAAMADTLVVPDFAASTAATAASVNTAFATVESSVNDNDGRITTNATDIGNNATAIGNNTINIGNNSASITTNTTDIGTNTSNIADNFSAITGNTSDIANNFNDLDQRLIPLEAGLNGQEVAVDCSVATGSADALLNTTLIPGNTYVIEGFCDGPISVFEPAGRYRFRGFSGDKTLDGILSPAGGIEYYVVSAFGPVSLRIDDLTISAVNYTTNADAYVAALRPQYSAVVSIYNSNIVGGDAGILVTESAAVYIGAGVEVTGWRETGLGAGLGGSMLAGAGVTVTGANGLAGTYSEAVVAYQGGSINIREGGTFSGGTDDGTYSDYESTSVGAYGNAMVRIDNSGTVNLTGGIESYRSSSVRIQKGTLALAPDTRLGGIEVGQASSMRLENMTINGEIQMYSANSYLRLQDSTHSGGDISIGATNSIYVMGGSLSTSSADAIAIGAQANMHLDGVTIGNNPATAEIDIGTFGILSHGGANFSSRGINCSTPGSFDVNDGIAIGTQTGC